MSARGDRRSRLTRPPPDLNGLCAARDAGCPRLGPTRPGSADGMRANKSEYTPSRSRGSAHRRTRGRRPRAGPRPGLFELSGSPRPGPRRRRGRGGRREARRHGDALGERRAMLLAHAAAGAAVGLDLDGVAGQLDRHLADGADVDAGRAGLAPRGADAGVGCLGRPPRCCMHGPCWHTTPEVQGACCACIQQEVWVSAHMHLSAMLA